eukprot:TRINITY_DN21785_c0_g2_i1.p1 TRINITY_DN21785_c0_g2~~TRINITY_DN21785_c0_g2_i1.p1  ORF type:complete len:516 (+),score=134.18 TRINITY_DN21785_c0_g2_i1:103-1650(+)
MRIKLRPVSGDDFEVCIDEDQTIETLKVVIISTRSELGDDPDALKLIHKGKILSDPDAVIQDLGIKDGDFLALMAKAAKPAAAAPAAPAAPAAAAPAAPAGAYAAAQQQAPPGSVMGPPSEEMVAALCGMGFGREEALRALRAAYNNPDRAMNFLLDGNIPAVPEPAAAVPGAAAAAPGGGAASSFPEALLGPQLLTQGGMPQPTAQALGGAKVVLLYFSAHWCPPCQQFTPMLANAFRALAPGTLQVVFVSSDRDQTSHAHYFATMPWVALPFGSPESQMLGQAFGVRGIPAVVALDGRTGSVLDNNARDAITRNRFDLAACCRGWGVEPAAAAPAAPAAPAEPARPAAPPRNPEPAAVAIDAAEAGACLDRVDALEWAVQETFYATLLKVLDNTLQNPAEEKFRGLKKGNAALQTKLFSVGEGAAAALLKLAGFNDGDEVVALPGPPDGRCTAVRDLVRERGEGAKMRQLRKERDERIAAEKDKNKGQARTMGGDGTGRNNWGADRRGPRGGG